MATNNLQSKLGLWLAEAQTANMDAAAYNRANASDPGRVQIEWGTSVWSQGAIWSQDLSPAQTSTPSPQPITQSVQTQALSAPSSPSQSPIIVNKSGASWSAPIWSAPVGMKTEKVKSLTDTQNPTTNGIEVGQLWAVWAQPLSLLQIRDQIKTQNPTLKPLEIMQQARQQYEAQKNVISPANGLPEIPKTGINAVDVAQAKLREETLQKIKDTYKSYAVAQGDYQKNAGYYTNFEGTNSTFNNVIKDIQNTLTNTKQSTLSEQEMQVIAARNGVSVDAVKNPLNIYNNLQMTEEGKQVLWVTNQENQIKDMQTENERKKIDAQTNLERNTQQLNYQIEDAERQMKQNTDWMVASGAWSGAGRSSGYEKGIQNIKDDTGRIISRINEQIGYLSADNEKYISRLTEDFTNNMSRATTQLTQNIQDLKHQTGLSLNGLEEKYGKWSKALLNQLNSIYEQFGMSSLDINGKYLDQVSKIQSITNDNISLLDKMNTVTNTLKNKRYNELLANNGALLQNMSLTSIADEVKNGNMDMWKYADVRNLMISTVTNSLAKNWVMVTQEALNTITHLIDNGATPSQAIARLTGWSITSTYSGGGLGDMRSLGYDENGNPKANGFAWAKNNNPAGITWNANFENKTPGSLADRLAKKWIQFVKGTERGPGEWGQYVQFASMDDGMEALRTLWEISSEKWQTIGDRLKNFSVAGYTLPVDMSKKFSELSTGEQNELLMLQIKKESPKLYEEIQKRGMTTQTQWKFTPDQIVWFDAYTKSNDIKDLQSHNLTLPMYNAYIAQKNAPETPNAQGYRLSDYTTRIRNMLPAGQADQPWEQAKIEKLAQQYIADGLSPEQASLKYLGFNIKDEKNTEIANSIRLAFQNMKTPPKWYEQKVSDMLNSGKTKEAYNFVNSFMDNDVKDKYWDKAILTQNFESSQSRIDKVVNLIQKNRDKIGAFDGPFTDFVKKFKNEPEYQELKTLMTMAQADIRKYFAGSAVTDTEMSALIDFIGGKTNMQPDNLVTQLNTIKNDVKQNFAFQRQVYGLDSSQQTWGQQAPPQANPATDKLRSYIQKVRNQ